MKRERLVPITLNILHGTVLVLALLVLTLPSYRSGLLGRGFQAAFFAQCAVSLVRAHRRGMLTRTPKQIYESVAAKGPLSSGPLEVCATICALPAVLVLMLS